MTDSFTEQLPEINHQPVLEIVWMKYFLFIVRSLEHIMYISGIMSHTYIHTLTGHFIRYILLEPGWTLFCLQNCLNYSWHRFNKVLETFLGDFGPYWHDSIRFVGCTSMMWISTSTTSQRCSIGLRSGASFIKCCTDTILNLILRSSLEYAYVWFIERTYEQKTCVYVSFRCEIYELQMILNSYVI